jgi:hypothetical protein
LVDRAVAGDDVVESLGGRLVEGEAAAAVDPDVAGERPARALQSERIGPSGEGDGVGLRAAARAAGDGAAIDDGQARADNAGAARAAGSTDAATGAAAIASGDGVGIGEAGARGGDLHAEPAVAAIAAADTASEEAGPAGAAGTGSDRA